MRRVLPNSAGKTQMCSRQILIKALTHTGLLQTWISMHMPQLLRCWCEITCSKVLRSSSDSRPLSGHDVTVRRDTPAPLPPLYMLRRAAAPPGANSNHMTARPILTPGAAAANVPLWFSYFIWLFLLPRLCLFSRLKWRLGHLFTFKPSVEEPPRAFSAQINRSSFSVGKYSMQYGNVT